MSNLTVFQFQQNQTLRAIFGEDGEPWFVAADVCAALELPNATRALARLDDDEQALISIQGISRGNDQVNVVSESGLYNLILGSRKPQAAGQGIQALGDSRGASGDPQDGQLHRWAGIHAPGSPHAA